MSFEPDSPFLGIHSNRSEGKPGHMYQNVLWGRVENGKKVETKLMPIEVKSRVVMTQPHGGVLNHPERE